MMSGWKAINNSNNNGQRGEGYKLLADTSYFYTWLLNVVKNFEYNYYYFLNIDYFITNQYNHCKSWGRKGTIVVICKRNIRLR